MDNVPLLIVNIFLSYLSFAFSYVVLRQWFLFTMRKD
jgi:hypothetical protein